MAASLSKRIPVRRARYATIRAKMAAPTACAARRINGSETNRFSMELEERRRRLTSAIQKFFREKHGFDFSDRTTKKLIRNLWSPRIWQ
jgi:hypothetical protein